MDLSEIVSISGLSGLFKVVAQRDNGLIVSSLEDEKNRFLSSRVHTFTSLDNITVYTKDDNKSLNDVLQQMKKLEANTKPVDPKAGNEELKTYFVRVLPDYDTERVYTSDIKKILKWYNILNDKKFIVLKEKKTKNPTDKKAGNDTEGDKASKQEGKKPAVKKTSAAKKATPAKEKKESKKSPAKKTATKKA